MGHKVICISLLVVSVFLVGFDYSNKRIPLSEIKSGGPPKDGIPALMQPKTISSKKADSKLSGSDRVIGMVINGKARAYPIRILNWHEIVNDRLGDMDIAVTYCPLCGTGMVFDAAVNGKKMTFGVSGKLYNSDVLLYDHESESLWSQLKMEAVTGKYSGKKLKLFPSKLTTWKDWKKRYPSTTVISFKTGYRRDYSRNPYLDYEQSRLLYFPVSQRNNRLHPKAWVIAIVVNNNAKAYPFSVLERTGSEVSDRVGGKPITVQFDSDSRSAVIRDGKGNIVPSVTAYWFAWFAFYPETGIYAIKN